jgi:hypothetical protein
MANHTSAILAINSLDRYITHAISQYGAFQATWANGSTTLTLVSGTPFLGADLSLTPGFAFGTTITAVAGLTPGSQITISLATTAAAGAPEVVLQELVVSNANQPTSNALLGSYFQNVPVNQTFAPLAGLGLNGDNNCNSFTIQSPAALIYGYVRKIMISQIQFSYNIPTVCRDKNDTLWIGGPTALDPLESITIPYGFYQADELAAALESLLSGTTIGAAADIGVAFDPREGFVFTSQASPAVPFFFPSPQNYTTFSGNNSDSPEVQVLLKTYKLVGITALESAEQGGPKIEQVSTYPNFLYTPFIDIYSDVLTNYQSIKDTTTFVNKNKGLVARIYLSGTGNIQETRSVTGLGTAPFIMTADLNTPKVIEWSPDVAVPTVDFRLLDCYGDLIPGPEMGQSTEFQMTLLCTEEG